MFLELVAALAAVDPVAYPLLAILAASLAVMPVGILLPCSACCGSAPCELCETGALPETVTVTFSGLADQSPGPDLCSLEFSACFGAGASGRVTAPGGNHPADAGPISAVEITNPGSGYAKLGRVAPTITASGGSGSGASMSVSLSSDTDACGVDRWSVASISVSGGTGYHDGDAVTLTPAGGDTTAAAASATIHTTRVAPTLSASVTSGTGTGATLSYSTSTTTDYDGLTVWTISGLTITAGGSGYVVGDYVTVTVTDGEESLWSYFSAEVSAVDGSGAITAISITNGGWYFKDNGIPASVSVESGGFYYREDAGEPPYVASVTVTVNQTAPSAGTGATITATVDDDTGSATFGQIVGLTIAAAGDDYLAWEWKNTKCCGDFWNGKTIVLKRNPWPDTGVCFYGHELCGVAMANGFWTRPPAVQPDTTIIQAEFRGHGLPMRLRLAGKSGTIDKSACFPDITYLASSLISDCSSFSVTFDLGGGASATIASGGTYDGYVQNAAADATGSRQRRWQCDTCCQGDAVPPLEVTASVSGTGADGLDGDYVLSLGDLTGFWAQEFLVWTINTFSPPGVIVTAGMLPCSTRNADGTYSPAVYPGDLAYPPTKYCDECHNKCLPTTSITNGSVNYFPAEACFEAGCSSCQTTPLCDPRGMTFTLCRKNYDQAAPYTRCTGADAATCDITIEIS